MKLNLVKTIRRNGHVVIAEDLLCDKCWEENKKLSCFQPDKFFEIKVVPMETEEYKCQDCE